jgi:hypothetical protein
MLSRGGLGEARASSTTSYNGLLASVGGRAVGSVAACTGWGTWSSSPYFGLP